MEGRREGGREWVVGDCGGFDFYVIGVTRLRGVACEVREKTEG